MTLADIREELHLLHGQQASAATLASVLDVKITDVRDLSLNINHHSMETHRLIASVHDHLLAVHHQVAKIHDFLESVTNQISAEREATMASNEGVRRQAALIIELLRDQHIQEGSARALEGVINEVEQAHKVVENARSQYRDPIPSDSSDFSPLQP
jgi:hypothetical protein